MTLLWKQDAAATRNNCRCVIVWLAALLIGVPAAAQTSSPERTIRPLRGAVYQATEGARTTLVFVSREGILLVDPLNHEFAQWLKAELDQRFRGQPVTYVVYTGLDFDRVAGATHYNSTAEIVAARGFLQRLKQSRELLPPRLASLDRDGSAALDRSELAGDDRSDALLRRDFNDDGRLSRDELWSTVYTPETSYSSRRTLTLGGSRIELIQPGPAFGDDTTAIYFPSERLVFATRVPSFTAPFSGQSARPADVATWARTITSLDFDTLMTGDGETYSRAQLAGFANYVTTLVSAVATGYERGHSIEQLQQGPAIEGFTGTPYGAGRNTDIEYVYRRTRLLTLDVTGAALVNKLTSDREYCGPGAFCDFGPVNGIGPAVTMALSIGRWRAMGEVNFGHDTDAVVGQPVWLTVHRRETLFSPLIGFRIFRSGALNVTVLGGPTFAKMNTAISYRSSSTPTFQQSTFKDAVRGYTFGGDVTIPLSTRLQLAIPLRVTTLPAFPLDPLRTTTNLRAGLGLNVALSQRAY